MRPSVGHGGSGVCPEPSSFVAMGFAALAAAV